MKIKKHSFVFIIVLCITAMAMAACGKKESLEADEVGLAAAALVDDEDMPDMVVGVLLPAEEAQGGELAEMLFRDQLEAAGFTAMVQVADGAALQEQVDEMIQAGAEAIVVGAVEGEGVYEALAEAQDAGVYVIGYDCIPMAEVDGVVRFGDAKIGEAQARALMDGLEAEKGGGPYHIELFGGDPADEDAEAFFRGAMTVLSPYMSSGIIVVGSGQTDFAQCATAAWSSENATARMAALLLAFYADEPLHGILCPDDGIARAVVTAAEANGQATPVVSGFGAELESVAWVWSGRQYATAVKSADALVRKTVEILGSLRAGMGMPAPDVIGTNGICMYEFAPLVVTKDNARAAFANDPARMALLQ